MDLIGMVGNIVTGGVGGGILGILGNYMNTRLAMAQAKQANEFELARIPLQLNADIERSKAQVAVAQEQGAAAGFANSQEADRVNTREWRWVSSLKGAMRPVLCTYLIVLTSVLFFMEKLTPEQQLMVVENIVTLTVVAVSWYFGARANAYVMQGFKSKAGN